MEFKSSFLNLTEKLFRQRGYWHHLRRNADEPTASVYSAVIADLDYVLGKATDHLSPEVLAEIHGLVQARQEERYQRRQNRFEPMFVETQ